MYAATDPTERLRQPRQLFALRPWVLPHVRLLQALLQEVIRLSERVAVNEKDLKSLPCQPQVRCSVRTYPYPYQSIPVSKTKLGSSSGVSLSQDPVLVACECTGTISQSF